MARPRPNAAVLAAVLLALAAPVSAQTPQIRPGLWEISMAGMPKPYTICYTPEMVADVKGLVTRGEQAGDCKSANAKTTGNTHTVDISCTKPNKFDAKVVMTVKGPESFEIRQDYAVEAGGKAQKGTMQMSYRRVGECK